MVYDRRGATSANFSKKHVSPIVSDFNSYYIERLDKTYVFPANLWFRIIWKIMSFFLDKRTVAKLVVMSGLEDLL